jgi:hypothetical protein
MYSDFDNFQILHHRKKQFRIKEGRNLFLHKNNAIPNKRQKPAISDQQFIIFAGLFYDT